MLFPLINLSHERLTEEISEQQDDAFQFLSALVPDASSPSQCRPISVVTSVFIVTCAVYAVPCPPSLSTEEQVQTTVKKLRRFQDKLLKNDPNAESAKTLARELQFCRSPADVRIGTLKKLALVSGVEADEAQLSKAPEIYTWLEAQVEQRRISLAEISREVSPQQFQLHPLQSTRAKGSRIKKTKSA